jgi:hypothetical protein
MQLHKIAANGDRIELTLIEPEPGGQPTYIVVVQSIEEFPAWISKAQLALDSARRERSLRRQRTKKDLQQRLQEIERQKKQIELQLAACDASNDQKQTLSADAGHEAAEVWVERPEVQAWLVGTKIGRAGPPTARHPTASDEQGSAP